MHFGGESPLFKHCYYKNIVDKGLRAKALGGCEGTEKFPVTKLHSQDVELMWKEKISVRFRKGDYWDEKLFPSKWYSYFSVVILNFQLDIYTKPVKQEFLIN